MLYLNMSLKEIVEEIVEVVNETTNDYDARENVLKVLKEKIEELQTDK
jgi:hypothetical protein|tara:strand:+ start:261 stop:404 length:144 start_codon:yes stop_codon:yes gene_type:complete